MKHFYVKVIGGLGNRMRAIDSAVALSQYFNAKLTIIWEKHLTELNCSYSDLFEPSTYFEVIETVSSNFLKRFNSLAYPKNSNGKQRKYKSLTRISQRLHKSTFKVSIYDNQLAQISVKIHAEHEDIDMPEYDQLFIKEFENQYLKKIAQSKKVYIVACYRFFYNHNKYNSLNPLPTILGKQDKAVKHLNNIIGVHIRRTDHKVAKKHSTLDNFKRIIEEEINKDRNARFYLATDSKDVEQFMKRNFGTKIHTMEKKFSRKSTDGVIDALVEMLNLSQTKKIYGSHFSSYSQIAAEIGNIERITV